MEIFFIGENADCVGAAFFVNMRYCHGVEILADKPSRRRCLFDLRDNVYAAAVGLGDGFVEIAALRQRSNLFFKLLKAHLRFAKFDLSLFIRNDFV